MGMVIKVDFKCKQSRCFEKKSYFGQLEFLGLKKTDFEKWNKYDMLIFVRHEAKCSLQTTAC